MKKIKGYNINIDLIRSLGIFGVVAIHTFNSVYERPDFFGGMSWWYSIIVDSMSRISIPLFIMVSGYLLLNKNEKFIITLKRIFNRLLIPLVAWTIITYVTNSPDDFRNIFRFSFYERFFAGNVYYYYFLTILIGLYFISPLLSNYLKNASLKSQQLMGYMFLLIGILETVGKYLIGNCGVENSFTKWIPFVGFFVMGHLIGNNKLKFKNKFLLKSVYLFGLITTVLLNYYFYSFGSVISSSKTYPSCLSHYSDYYLSFNVVLMTTSAFILLFKSNFSPLKNKIISKIVYSIARNSFGIYLVHLFIVSIWDNWFKWTVDNTHLPLWGFVTVKFVGIFIASYIFIFIFRKIPVLKKLIGE